VFPISDIYAICSEISSHPLGCNELMKIQVKSHGEKMGEIHEHKEISIVVRLGDCMAMMKGTTVRVYTP